MIIDESLTARRYTEAKYSLGTFGYQRTISSITIHHWGVTGQTHDGVNNFFVNTAETSAHFVASDGRVNCLVSPEDVAWHAGNAYGNATSVGIECRPEATDGDYVTVAELVRWIRSQYGDLPLVPHRDWQNTACPGVWDLERIDRMARETPSTEQETSVTLNAKQDKDLTDVRDRVMGRDVQRYHHPTTGEVSLTAKPGFVPTRSTDLHDILSTNNKIDALQRSVDALAALIKAK